jgi:Protein of unknown function (DUF2851)
MKEDLLYYLWRMKRFDLFDLKTTSGEPIIIQNTGELNTHSGPDFTNARIQIADTLWAGNVEMHVNSSDWLAHHHQEDQAYDSVILHVVMEEDQVVKRKNGERIPCLEMKKRIPPKISKTYQKLLHNEYWIPCQHLFHKASEITINLWLDRLLVERLESKTVEIEYCLQKNKNSWEETFYQFLARNFGVKVNAEPFEQLAKTIPLLTLSKYKNSLIQLEALLFGQAGLLENSFKDAYPKNLRKEYQFLKKKHHLKPIKGESWKLMRLRPANFPSIRIAQFATLIHQSVHLFSKILAAKNVKEIENMFDIKISNYWQTHYVFDKKSIKRNKSFGKSAIHLLIINTIVPFLFLYGKLKDDDRFKDRALSLLEELKPEKNHIIDKWKNLGVEPASAYQTQALLQLKNNYCKTKKCINCAIGSAVLNM